MTQPTSSPPTKRSASDFVFGRAIGQGSFSTVYLAKDVHTNREFAIKVLQKRQILHEKKTKYVNREKQVLQILGSACKYFVHLYFTFQDTDRLYFVLSYARNGELLQQLKQCGLPVETARYYACELVLALEYLRIKGIVHRDLKPENVLFDGKWHLLITDFGSAKIIEDEPNEDDARDNCTNSGSNEVDGGANTESSHQRSNRRNMGSGRDSRRRNSFVGTAQFVSPEILNDIEATHACDLWALGCIIFQMICGRMAFCANGDYLTFQKILKLDYQFPDKFDPLAKDLVEKLLVIAGSKRLGAMDGILTSDTNVSSENSDNVLITDQKETKIWHRRPTQFTQYTSIRQHSFFRLINWNDLGPSPLHILKSANSTTLNGDDMTKNCSADCKKNGFGLHSFDATQPGFDEGRATQMLIKMQMARELSEEETEFGGGGCGECCANNGPVSESRANDNINKSTAVVSSSPTNTCSTVTPKSPLNCLLSSSININQRLLHQKQHNDKYHDLVGGNLILKQGLVEKKSFFSKTRMLLLTAGPHLYYADPQTFQLKGEIPWSESLRAEPRNFKKFLIYTPNRLYNLEDPEGFAMEWCKAILDVKAHYYPSR